MGDLIKDLHTHINDVVYLYKSTIKYFCDDSVILS